MEKIIYYSVHDGGDGSAYPHFFDNEKLSEWDQDHMTDGWGEPCTGTLKITGDNIVVENAMFNESYLWELIDDIYDDSDQKRLDEFIKDFFPNGIPNLEARMYEDRHYGIYIGDKFIGRAFAYPEKRANKKGLKRTQVKIDKIKNKEE